MAKSMKAVLAFSREELVLVLDGLKLQVAQRGEAALDALALQGRVEDMLARLDAAPGRRALMFERTPKENKE